MTNATNEWVSGSVSVTATGVGEDQGSTISGGPGASAGGAETPKEAVASVMNQPEISLHQVCTGCAESPGDANYVQNIVRKKGSGVQRSRFQVRKMTKETSRMLEEERGKGKEDAMLLAKVSGFR